MTALASLEADDGYILENGFYKKIVGRFGLAAIVGMPEREPLHPRHVGDVGHPARRRFGRGHPQ